MKNYILASASPRRKELLGELGITPTDEQLHTMAKMCYTANNGPAGSAKVLVEEDFYQIYKAAL